MPAQAVRTISIDVACNDVLMFRADVLALKHAGRLYGADKAVVEALEESGIGVRDRLPSAGGFHLIRPDPSIPFDSVIFVGTRPLHRFTYTTIRNFSRRVMALLAIHTSQTRHLALTLHGVGIGLDESEALRSEVAGLLDAVAASEHPESLERITIVEQSPSRAARLKQQLSALWLQQSRQM